MKTILASALLALATAFAPPASAQLVPEVPDDSYYGFGSDIVHVDVTDDGSGGVLVTGTSSGGFSNPAPGTQGPSSTAAAATCTKSAIFLIGADEYVIDHGQVKKKNRRGKWVKQPKVKPPKKKGSRNSYIPPGNIIGSSVLPDDDVVGLPH